MGIYFKFQVLVNKEIRVVFLFIILIFFVKLVERYQERILLFQLLRLEVLQGLCDYNNVYDIYSKIKIE